MKQLVNICIFLFLTSAVSAQSVRDSFLISPRLSFADFSDKNNWDGYSINKIPPTALQVEKFYNNYFSYGGFIGFYRDKFTNDTMSSNFYREVNFAFGAVASLHYGQWIERLSRNRIRFNDFDLYLSAMLGWEIKNSAVRDELSEDGLSYDDTNNTDVKFIFGPALGVRYYISDRFAMSLEVGTGNLGLVTMGVNWNIARTRLKKQRVAPKEPIILYPNP